MFEVAKFFKSNYWKPLKTWAFSSVKMVGFDFMKKQSNPFHLTYSGGGGAVVVS